MHKTIASDNSNQKQEQSMLDTKSIAFLPSLRYHHHIQLGKPASMLSMYLFRSHTCLSMGELSIQSNNTTTTIDCINQSIRCTIGPPRLFPPLSMDKQTSKRGGSYCIVALSIYLFRSHLLEYGGTVANQYDDTTIEDPHWTRYC